ncbi:MAG TPA: hypothetical protein VG435_13720 [Acidimicrobiales bacterium]|nr:hypothetical protein [Acidimicrobiales bacterium]
MEVWDGTSWAIQTTPPGKGALSGLDAVSCSSSDACVALGSYENLDTGAQGSFADVWDGASWQSQDIPAHQGATYSFVSGLSCPAVNSCTAVGSYVTATGAEAELIEIWNGTTWSIQNPSSTNGFTNATLSGVSCPAVDSCTAVGSYSNASGVETTLIQTGNGTTWTVQKSSGPKGSANSFLSDVSCSDTVSCTAVGSSSSATGNEAPLVEVWNGTAWKVQPAADPTGADLGAVLNVVSCASAGACSATGSADTESFPSVTFIEQWNGTRWTIQSPAPLIGTVSTSLSAVSCPAANSCEAVGGYAGESGQATTAARWDGTTWKLQATPNPAGAPDSILSAVSCTSADACVAVGSAGSMVGPIPGGQTTLAEVWNGSTWKIQPTPNPTGATDSSLTAVSCTSADACVAVGSAGTTDGSTFGSATPLAEVWNGSVWRIRATPMPRAAVGGADLEGVSCPTTQDCVAVGAYYTQAGPEVLAEGWNGTVWKIQPSQKATNSTLFAVSCTSTLTCIAVGDYENRADQYAPLSEEWNGTNWSTKSAPLPAGANNASLYGISCPAANSCTAVGGDSADDTSGLSATVSEIWNGASWEVQATPIPQKAIGGALASVSCTSTTACAAVGSYTNISGLQSTLAEAEGGE